MPLFWYLLLLSFLYGHILTQPAFLKDENGQDIVCVVCTDKSSGKHYGQFTCEGEHLYANTYSDNWHLSRILLLRKVKEQLFHRSTFWVNFYIDIILRKVMLSVQ
jgi:hypothetical protein